jgi:hypothetical protein
VGGLVGALLTGAFASLAINPAGADGSLMQIARQATAAGVTLVFAFVVTLAILKLVDRLVGFRATEEAEEIGLDLAEHRETGYTLRERGHAPVGERRAVFTDAELAALREQIAREVAAMMAEDRRPSVSG